MLLVMVGGCHAQPKPELPVADSWIEIAEPAFAKTHSNVTKHTALPFEFLRDGVDGTQLVLQFLDRAESRGAKYASNLAIVLQMQHDGAAIECISRIVPEGTPPPKTTDVDSEPDDDTAGTTTLKPWTPNLITATVDDHRFECAQVGERVYTTQSDMESSYNADQKLPEKDTNIPMGAAPVTADWHDECHLVSDRHEVQRYEHFVASHFEPPDWRKLGKAFGGLRLVELPPECHAIATPARIFQRIEADLGYSGQRPQTARKPMQERLKTQFSMSLAPTRMYLDF